jgi:ATP-binding cassette subfamily B protein RaxB
MQDDSLFSGTIEDNISVFDKDADFDRVVEVARLACVHDDIERMPLKYLSLVGDMGASLSGGQKQRIILARALYAKGGVLVLDEATSHLDVATERQVTQAVSAMNATRIVLAHRPQTIESCDSVFLLVDSGLKKIR